MNQAVFDVAKHGGDLSPLIKRLEWLSTILDLHAQGEEEVVFPAVDKVAPKLSPLFVDDHREMDGVKGLIQGAMKSDDWSAMTKRIPNLT